MLLALAAAATSLATGSPTPQPRSVAPCERAEASFAEAMDARPSFRRLDQMPAARQILGVLHQEGGCIRPIVVREQVGQPGRLPSSSR